MFRRFKEYFLACVLGVFPVSTYLHAEREDCLLNKFEDTIMTLRISRSQQVDRLLYFRSHAGFV
jgi:hypothetical protein